MHEFDKKPSNSTRSNPFLPSNGRGPSVPGDEGGQLPIVQQSFSVLFENAPDAMVICDASGCILRVNSEMERLFGYQRHELVGERVEKLLPDRLRHAHEQYRNTYAARPKSRAMSESPKIWGLRRDGSEVHLEISLNPIESDGGFLLYGIIRARSDWASAEMFRRRAELERALSELTARFVNLPMTFVDGEIRNGLKAIADALGADRATVALLQEDSGDFLATYAWAAPDTPEFPRQFARDLVPWLVERVLSNQATLLRRRDAPPEAHCERALMESVGSHMALVVPFRVGGKIIGVMSCGCFSNEDQAWDEVTLSRFQAAADVLANALGQKEANEKLNRAYIEIQQLRERLEKENLYLREEIKLEHSHHSIMGQSPAIRSVLKKAEQVARTDSTVLILGETGTGKELIARAIHEMSTRNKHVMVKTNCAALPATLIESELFGRERGAYTGALAKEIGRFELADRSTIFLDEVGEIPLEVQSKLLRILQDGQFERLGSSKTLHVDVRVIAATNRNLESMVKDGKFREDLFYRLNVFPIHVPPLRERTEDIPALVRHILEELCKRMGRNIEGIEARTMQSFQRYSWPGNVRELRNVIERNLILNTGTIFRTEAQELQQKSNFQMRRLDEVELEYLRSILQAANWRVRGKGGASEIIGLKPTTLEARMKKLGIHRPD
jgi:formate hydrogenlyase transcriptional activator